MMTIGLGIILFVVTALLSVVAFKLRNRLYRAFNLPVVELAAGASEAERFAHLLVTELKLYNLQEVEAVARGGTPSPELVAEVAEAFTKYREHVPESAQGEHFSAAILAILAGGNRSAQARLLAQLPNNSVLPTPRQ